MSHPKYKDIGDPADRLIEELSEAIKAVCKGKRFGWKSCHPDDHAEETNIEALYREMRDIDEAWAAFCGHITDSGVSDEEHITSWNDIPGYLVMEDPGRFRFNGREIEIYMGYPVGHCILTRGKLDELIEENRGMMLPVM